MGWFRKTTAIAFEPNRIEVGERHEGVSHIRRISVQSVGIPPNIICEATAAIRDRKALDECLQRILGAPSLFMPNLLAIGLPSAACYLRSISITLDGYQSVHEWLRRNLQKMLPCDLSLLVWATAINPSPAERNFNILLVAVKRELLLSYIGLAATQGRELSLIMPTCIARWNAVCADFISPLEDPLMLVHTFGDSFEMSLWRGRALIGLKKGVVPPSEREATIAWLRSREGMEDSAAGISDGMRDDDHQLGPTRCLTVVRGESTGWNLSSSAYRELKTIHSARGDAREQEQSDCNDHGGAHDGALGLLLPTQGTKSCEKGAPP